MLVCSDNLHIGIHDAYVRFRCGILYHLDFDAGHITGTQHRHKLITDLGRQSVVHVRPQVTFQIGIHPWKW